MPPHLLKDDDHAFHPLLLAALLHPCLNRRLRTHGETTGKFCGFGERVVLLERSFVGCWVSGHTFGGGVCGVNYKVFVGVGGRVSDREWAGVFGKIVR